MCAHEKIMSTFLALCGKFCKKAEQYFAGDMQKAAKLSEEDKRKKNGASKNLAQSVSVYSWLQKRGKTIKKFVDIKTRRDMKEVK